MPIDALFSMFLTQHHDLENSGLPIIIAEVNRQSIFALLNEQLCYVLSGDYFKIASLQTHAAHNVPIVDVHGLALIFDLAMFDHLNVFR